MSSSDEDSTLNDVGEKRDAAQPSAPGDALEHGSGEPTVGIGCNIANMSVVDNCATGEIVPWAQGMGIRVQALHFDILDMDVTAEQNTLPDLVDVDWEVPDSGIPVIDAADQQSLPLISGETDWVGPFTGADELNDANDISWNFPIEYL